jgi:hypothetical protein
MQTIRFNPLVKNCSTDAFSVYGKIVMLRGQQFISIINQYVFPIELVDICFCKTPSYRPTGNGVIYDKSASDLTVGQILFFLFHLVYPSCSGMFRRERIESFLRAGERWLSFRFAGQNESAHESAGIPMAPINVPSVILWMGFYA